jgi:glutathione reductase (NADPH)
MRGFDDDVRRLLADQMRKKGIDLRFEKNLTSIERSDTGLRLSVDDGSTLEADQVLYATGRVPKTADLGLEEAGVELGRNGEVIVDAYSRSSVSHIYAIGDCTDRLMLTPVAIAEGIAFANTVFAGTSPARRPGPITPTCRPPSSASPRWAASASQRPRRGSAAARSTSIAAASGP